MRINEQIRISEIRVIGAEGEQLGVMSPQAALAKARETDLDLVEVAPMSRPPVCRIMDYSKFKYDQGKKEKEARKHQHVIKIKEVRYKVTIEEHDYQTKLKHMQDFLQKGNKVKVSLRFRGREAAHQETGRALMQRIISDVAGCGEAEKPPRKEGAFMNMVLMPK
ncbi:MAG: translation initiation factor IF-3 [Candidatus Omnitrophica bacterium]|nr:translation initiation factor IF-3 [Candidatus Omnitrophota bacterium]